jgi:hypothetical protein
MPLFLCQNNISDNPLLDRLDLLLPHNHLPLLFLLHNFLLNKTLIFFILIEQLESEQHIFCLLRLSTYHLVLYFLNLFVRYHRV